MPLDRIEARIAEVLRRADAGPGSEDAPGAGEAEWHAGSAA